MLCFKVLLSVEKLLQILMYFSLIVLSISWVLVSTLPGKCARTNVLIQGHPPTEMEQCNSNIFDVKQNNKMLNLIGPKGVDKVRHMHID